MEILVLPQPSLDWPGWCWEICQGAALPLRTWQASLKEELGVASQGPAPPTWAGPGPRAA